MGCWKPEDAAAAEIGGAELKELKENWLESTAPKALSAPEFMPSFAVRELLVCLLDIK